jgi:hydroxyacylglutathione hydrolase
MTLEDHLGDIIRKGRDASGAAALVAAQAAGLTEADYNALEETGRVSAPVHFQALGQAIGLNGAKLERIAKGWLPAPRDLSQWRELRQITTTANDLTVHCYLVWDEVSREAALFDTGWDAAPIFQLDRGQRPDVAAPVPDAYARGSRRGHGGGAREISQTPFAHQRQERPAAAPQPGQRFHASGQPAPDQPRHARPRRGWCHVYCWHWPDDAPHVALVGDAIFAGSMGRGNQSWDLARQKVREQILTLPDETLLCPGHGPLTTVAEEKANNPFF